MGGYLAVHAAADAARRDVRRWAVRDLMERDVITEEDRATATEAAAATFSALERWLDHVAAPSPAS